MMRYLISILLFAVLSSCSLQTTEGLRTIEQTKSSVENQYFSNTNSDYVYKAKLDIYGNYFGGILIIKKTDVDTHRVVFTTEFGNKLFDFLFEGDTFTKNFAVEELDRKLVINTLKRDFQIMLRENAEVLVQWSVNEGAMYQTKEGNRFNFYIFSSNEERLEEIVHTSAVKEKLNVVFTSEDGKVAQSIKIKHQNIKLTIALEKFENQ